MPATARAAEADTATPPVAIGVLPGPERRRLDRFWAQQGAASQRLSRDQARARSWALLAGGEQPGGSDPGQGTWPPAPEDVPQGSQAAGATPGAEADAHADADIAAAPGVASISHDAPRGALSPAATPPAGAAWEQADCALETIGLEALRLPASGQPRLLLAPGRGRPGQEELLAALDQVLAATLPLPGRARLTSWPDLQSLLALERSRDLLGCDEVTCLAELGALAAADYVLQAELGQIAGAYLLSLRAVDTRQAAGAGWTLLRFGHLACALAAAEQAAGSMLGR